MLERGLLADLWAVVAQTTAAVTTTLVAVTATAAFLLRKRQRVRELRWLIRAEVKSLEVNAARYIAPDEELITAEWVMALVRDTGRMESLISDTPGFYEPVHRIH